jgi:uncharacterized protein YecT (DUF1311 family)
MTQQHDTRSRQTQGKRYLLLAALLLAGNGLAAVTYPKVAPKGVAQKGDWYGQCLRVKAQQAPPRDLPHSGNFERCAAADLYYDTANMDAPTDADWQKVRECAFRTNDTGVLMMLYANGRGVSKNLGLATKYACSLESTPAELKARVDHLRRTAAGGQMGAFDQCDDSNSTNMQGSCAAFRERQRDAQRSARLAAIAKTWSSKEQLNFDIVSKALHDFAQHRSAYETDLSGTARLAMQVEASASELDQFARDIEDFESGKRPRFSEAEFQVLDEKMNRIYQHFMATPVTDASYLGTIRKSAVERTQHAWLAYRDAMELFASVHYPSVPASAWRALLTGRRLRQVMELDNAVEGR